LRNWYLQHVRIKRPESSVTAASEPESVSSEQHEIVLGDQKATMLPQDASKNAEKRISRPTDPEISDIEYDDSEMMKQTP
jgi:hypothetical protein